MLTQGATMRLNIPLLPLQIEIRWRSLPRVRFSIRGVMLIVAIAGIYLSLLKLLGRLAALNNYHADRIGPAGGENSWHWAMYNHYHDDIARILTIITIINWTILTLLALFVIGRFL